MTKTIRVRESNAAAALAAIPGAAIVAPPKTLHGGCGSPGCCGEHPGTHGGEPVVGLRLPPGMSGRAAHRALVGAGVPVKAG